MAKPTSKEIGDFAHKNFERIFDAANRQMFDLDNPGFCVRCGEEQEGHEPDARNHECECCGEMAVFGAAELAFYV